MPASDGLSLFLCSFVVQFCGCWKPLADCKLYTFVDTAYLHGRAPEAVAQQLCDGGSDLIQLRAKNLSAAEIRAMAEKILPVTRRANVGLVINDHLEIARAVGAEFCHLGQEDFFDAGHRHISEIRNPESGIRIGLSTHAPEQAQRALAAGADYIAIGPIYATGTGAHGQASVTPPEYARPLGGGARHRALVCHRRHQFTDHRRRPSNRRETHLRGLRDSERTGHCKSVRGVQAQIEIDLPANQ